MVPVVTMANVMKSAGMGRIVKLGKVLSQSGDDIIREATFANGRVGTYRVSNFMGKKTQSVWDGARSVTFDTTKGSQALCSVPTKNGVIELFPRTHQYEIKEAINGSQRTLAYGRANVEPISVNSNIVNGKVQKKVFNNQEIHTSTIYSSDNGFGRITVNNDLLLSPQGKAMPIYQRPNCYIPAQNAGFGKDLSRKPVFAGDGIRPSTQYTAQTPITTLNSDLGANFQPKVNPIWSRLEEMFWRLA